MKCKASKSFHQLVDDHYQGLYRFAYSLCKDEHTACDLTQQTFTIYAQKGDSIRDPGKAKSWLFTTLYREFLRLYRRNHRTESRDPEILEETFHLSETPNPDTLDHPRVLGALEQLEEIYRVPLTLFYLRSLSYIEISEVLDMPIGTVTSRLSRGKTRLKRIFLDSTEIPNQ